MLPPDYQQQTLSRKGTSQTAAAANPLLGQAALYQQMNAPQIDQIAIQQDLLGAQFGVQNQLAGVNSQYAQQSANFAAGNVALSQQDLLRQYAAANRQWPLMQHQQQFQELQFALQGKALNDQGQAIGDQNKALHHNYNLNLEQLRSQGAAAGNTFTKGHRDQRNDLTFQFHQGERQIGREQRQLGRERLQLGGQKGLEEQQYQESLLQHQDMMQQMVTLGQRYGISQQEIQARLNNQLQNLGLNAQLGSLDVFSQQASLQGQLAQLQTPPLYLLGMGVGG